MLTIGSTALEYHKVNIGRKPTDHDVLCTLDTQEYYKAQGYDTICVTQEIIDAIPRVNGYATPSAVLTLKASSLGWDIHWEKHKRDVLLLKYLGFNIIPELYTPLSNYWKEVRGNKPYLNFYKTKNEFFNDYVTYHYDHDYLHEVLAYPNKPLYLSLLEEGQEVAIDYNKFKELPYLQKIQLFKEEIGVIATERWLVPPTKLELNWIQAYLFALKKMLVSLTKDWQTDFLVYNLEEFSKPDFNLFKNFLQKGIITMKCLTGEELDVFLIEMLGREKLKEVNQDYFSSLDYIFHESESINIPDFRFIEQEGGVEGTGEYCHVVFKYKDVFYKIIGRYTSFNGVTIDGGNLYIVTPQQKMITAYE